MSTHESAAAKLALLAAGALSPEEALQVEQHTRECVDCRRNLEVWGVYARGLAQLPQPQVPLGLIARTQARVLRDRQEASERRRSSLMFGALAIFSWVMTVATWLLARFLTGGVLQVFGVNLVSLVSWFVAYSVLAVTTAAVTAAMLSRHSVRRIS